MLLTSSITKIWFGPSPVKSNITFKWQNLIIVPKLYKRFASLFISLRNSVAYQLDVKKHEKLIIVEGSDDYGKDGAEGHLTNRHCM